MHWYPRHSLNPSDGISGIAFGADGMMACSSWDGSLNVGTRSELSEPQSQSSLTVKFSRPLTAVSWGPSGKLWCGGGENRVCAADVYSLDSQARVWDVCETGQPVIDIASGSNFTIAATAMSLIVLDDRTKPVMTRFINTMATAADVKGNYACTAVENNVRIFDMRGGNDPVHWLSFDDRKPVLQAKWLDSETCAIADNASHVRIINVNKPELSYDFYSNRMSSTKRPRPIHALAKVYGNAIATGGGDHHVYIWDYKRKKLRTKIAFPLTCTALAYSEADRAMAVAISDDQWCETRGKFSERSLTRVMVTPCIQQGHEIDEI